MIIFKAMPLAKYSSLHTLSLFSLLGLRKLPRPAITMAFNFNLSMSVDKKPQAQLSFHLRDTDIAQPENTDFSISRLTRWRMNIAQCASFNDYLQTLKSNHLRNYRKTLKALEESESRITLINDDWSDYAETVHQLYLNVAKRHGSQLYDINFFRAIAKIKEYQLICLFNRDKMIGVLIIFDEEPVYHSMLCGFDYIHSSKLNAYSLLHYELIRLAISAKKYTVVDAGITANKAKSMLNLKPVSCCMDITAKNFLVKHLLRVISRFVTTNINEDGRLQFKFR